MAGPIPTVEERRVKSPVEDNLKKAISVTIARKAELKEKRVELESELGRVNPQYIRISDQLKELTKIKKDEKDKALKNPDVAELNEAVKDLARDTKEIQMSLFDYLLQYKNDTGADTIQDNTGQTHVIDVKATIKI